MSRTAKFPPKMIVGITVGDVIDIVSDAYPNREAAVVGPYRKTWQQLKTDVDHLAIGLYKLGMKIGDRACIWSKNNYQWIVAMFAIVKAGGIIVPLDHWYKKHEAEYILNHSGARFIICTEDYIPLIETMKLEPTQLVIMNEEPKQTLNNGQIAHFWTIVNSTYNKEDYAMLESIRRKQNADEVTFILYTSGTTGNPKGAMLTHNNMIQNMIETSKIMRIDETDVNIIPVPFSHCFGCEIGILIAALTGSKIVPLLDQDPKTALQTVMKEKGTVFHGTPTHFIRYVREYRENKDKYDLSSLRTGIIGGAPSGKELLHDIIEVLHIPDISHAYGLTEASPLVTATKPTDPMEKREDTAGQAYPGLDVKIVDDNNKEVPAGTAGELVVKGWSVMKGYFKAPDMTAQAIDENGYLHTGDLATIDNEGYYRIVGRKKDMIIYGGANVYPKMVEDYLLTNPNILECAIIGIPDKEYGEVVGCVAVVKPGFTEQQLVDFCFGQINDFAVPRYVRFDIPLPLSGRGKIQKFKLRQTLAEMREKGQLGNPIIPTAILERKKKKQN